MSHYCRVVTNRSIIYILSHLDLLFKFSDRPVSLPFSPMRTRSSKNLVGSSSSPSPLPLPVLFLSQSSSSPSPLPLPVLFLLHFNRFPIYFLQSSHGQIPRQNQRPRANRLRSLYPHRNLAHPPPRPRSQRRLDLRGHIRRSPGRRRNNPTSQRVAPNKYRDIHCRSHPAICRSASSTFHRFLSSVKSVSPVTYSGLLSPISMIWKAHNAQ
jgi:hypothetical protein